jgi:hypothetical protein
MPYPEPLYTDEATRNRVMEGVALLGGADNGGTKLWWDKNPNH